jgi:Caspase domain
VFVVVSVENRPQDFENVLLSRAHILFSPILYIICSEDDGYDESLIPVDFRENGQIVDDDILKYFCKRMKGGVHVTVVMDCCHSGTVLDLPYTFPATEKTMQIEKGFLFDDDEPRTNKKKIDGSHRTGNSANGSSGGSQKKKEKPKARKKTIAEQPMKPPEPRKPTQDLPVPPPPPGCCSVM